MMISCGRMSFVSVCTTSAINLCDFDLAPLPMSEFCRNDYIVPIRDDRQYIWSIKLHQ